MYARLNFCGVQITISGLTRYAGMLSGTTEDGKPYSRPLADFNTLSLDGVLWQAQAELRHLIPWKDNHVPGFLCLPDAE